MVISIFLGSSISFVEMKDFFGSFRFFIFFFCSFAFGVYIKDEEPSTRAPLRVEELPWLTFFDRKSSSDEFGRKERVQTPRRNTDLVSHSQLCPPGETGQFPYPPDCKRFINCWKGRGSVQVCAPGTLFNPETLECDFPGKVKCEDSFGGFGDHPAGERYVRFPHQRPQIIHNPRIARKNQEDQSKPDSVPAKPYPGRPPYFGPSHLLPPTRPVNQTQGREVRPQCVLGATGLYPHPYDCTKFLKCWSGNTFIQNCGPGTFFNPLISACDHPRNVPCAHEGSYEPARPDIPVEDLQIPEESVQYEQYQKVTPVVKDPSLKGGKKSVKLDPESPNYGFDPPIGTSSPKSEAKDLEPHVVSQTSADLTHRNPKVINVGNSQQNQFATGFGKEPAPYLTPPQYDVYGNLISTKNSRHANLGVQPNNFQVRIPENLSMYPSNPYLINYPPQGPFQPGNQQKDTPYQKQYYGYMLSKKHSPHPHHPHHTGPPTWLVPPPFQPQFFPYYAPYHPFFSELESSPPHPPFHTPHFMHVPYYPSHISGGNPCTISKPENAKPEPSAPKCEPGTSFYKPSPSSHSSGHLSGVAGIHPQPGNLNPQIESSFNPSPGMRPSNPPPSGPGYNPHFQIIVPNSPSDSNLNYQPSAGVHPMSFNPQTTGNPAFLPTVNANNLGYPDGSNFYPGSHTPSLIPSQPPNTKHPKSPEILKPQYPTSNLTPQNNQNVQPQPNIPPSVQPTPEYQPYLFYYYPFNSNLYSYYSAPYYPNLQPTPHNPQTSKTNPQGQATIPDSFSNSPAPVNQGPVEVPDSFDSKNFILGAHPTVDSFKPTSLNREPPQQRPGGQEVLPDPFDNKNYIVEDKTSVPPTKHSESVHGTPYYPAYNPKDSSRPGYSSNIVSTSPHPKETATFPPFPGNKPLSGNIKTGVKSKDDAPKIYILGNIDVRTGEEDENVEDAESIPTTQPAIRKRGGEKIDPTIVKPSYTHPDKYSEPETTSKVPDVKKSTEEPTQFAKPDSHTQKPKPRINKPQVKVKQTPPNGQIVRLRNGASHLDGYLEMKDSKSKWGLVCDEPGHWGIAKATVACRELGFIRGAELSWQGYPIKSDTEELEVAVKGINCTGTETSLSECKITLNDKSECDVGRNAVGLRCFDNLASHCQPGEILYNQHCYKLHGKKNPDDPWIKTEEASEECKKYGGKLVDITSQYENDFISEWLVKKHPDVTAVATGGIGISVLGRPMWLWEGTSDPMVYERWWSGWSGEQNIPQGSIDGPLCIILRKTFSCVDDDPQKNKESTNDEETCSADYFFWDVEDCNQLRTSVFICERPMDDIGCVVGNGEGYVGTANTTASGLPCLPWDHPKVVEGLARRGTSQERSSRLVGHNYCRNLGNPDRHPWCFVEGRGNSEYCAIPQCWDSVSGSYSRSSGRWSSCDPNHFECKPGECVQKKWICDGQNDCSNGRDEETCKVFIQEFTTERNKRIRGRGNEKWPNVNENVCAKLCLENKNFRCKSFSFNVKDKECYLSDSNIGLSGQVVNAKGWIYHERTTDSLKCSVENGFFGCQNGKCINISNVCDGKKNCEDSSDERDCQRLGYQIRLAGSQEKHRGRVEVKILGKWGVICDDKFDMRDAEVVCRELGFKLGAAEVLKQSEFPVENPLFLVDHLECLGNETTIRKCPFPGWGRHNCQPEEVVGVSCRVPGIECPEGQWKCARSKECISLAYLCDELKDCDDGTDEDKLMCESPTQIRLSGGPNATSGRLEIRRYNIWGTVCHDDFNAEAGRAVCSLLGFSGPSAVKKSAYFGPGKGPIWLDNGLCFVNETDLEECTKHVAVQNNCKHDEDVSLICSQEEFYQKSSAVKPIAASSADDDTKRSEEKLRRTLMTECSGKAQSRILQEKYEKVVGGSNVAREALPWQASIRVRSGGGKSVHWCGAIVVSPYHVLTAGHCLRDYNKAAYFVRVGDYDTKVPDPHEREFGIEHLYMHPNFSKNINLNNDIGLIKVKGEILLGEHIKPACLAPSVDVYQPGTNCSVSGWGSVSANAAGYARTLRRAFVPILEPSVCRAPFVYGESLSEGMFCAGHLDGGVDSCQGDSGGPLMCQYEGREYLFGITSWGHGCGRANKPGVYTNVAFYTDWIQQKIQSSFL